MTTIPTAAELESLRWYLNRANQGRGRIVGETAKLLKRGWLKLTWTGHSTWSLTLSANGRKALELVDHA